MEKMRNRESEGCTVTKIQKGITYCYENKGIYRWKRRNNRIKN